LADLAHEAVMRFNEQLRNPSLFFLGQPMHLCSTVPEVSARLLPTCAYPLPG
jgi:hypothetical protein